LFAFPVERSPLPTSSTRGASIAPLGSSSLSRQQQTQQPGTAAAPESPALQQPHISTGISSSGHFRPAALRLAQAGLDPSWSSAPRAVLPFGGGGEAMPLSLAEMMAAPDFCRPRALSCFSVEGVDDSHSPSANSGSPGGHLRRTISGGMAGSLFDPLASAPGSFTRVLARGRADSLVVAEAEGAEALASMLQRASRSMAGGSTGSATGAGDTTCMQPSSTLAEDANVLASTHALMVAARAQAAASAPPQAQAAASGQTQAQAPSSGQTRAGPGRALALAAALFSDAAALDATLKATDAMGV
jgi:hypothetical protein